MVINRDLYGYVGYCHRCQETQVYKTGQASIRELAEYRAALRDYTHGDIKLPVDFTQDIPSDGRVWLLKSGVNDADCKRYGFGWSERLGRIILPIWERGELLGTVARRIRGTGPKYIENLRKGGEYLFQSTAPRRAHSYYDAVLTEDILSAVRVGRIVNAVAVLGTTLRIAGIQKIILPIQVQCPTKSLRIGVWCDGDNAGRIGAAAIVRTLALSGINARSIRTDKDPKYYSNREIRNILND
jgi:hypothetical protein